MKLVYLLGIAFSPVFLAGCKKPYVDIQCDDVTLCVHNTSADTLFINWFGYGYETEWPVAIPPDEYVCKGFGPFEEYGKSSLFTEVYSLSGTNSVNYSTSNGKYYAHRFESCEDHSYIFE